MTEQPSGLSGSDLSVGSASDVAPLGHGGPAFPIFLHEDERYTGVGSELGMTLRDYFAAKAMQAIAPGAPHWHGVATEAYRLADEMLRARATS